jgi:putative endonuclease
MLRLFGPRRYSSAALGRAGEARARFFYRLRGYGIVGSNLRLRAGELDLVVRRGKLLAIVEVKTRQSESGGEGHVQVDAKKRMRMIRAAEELVNSRRDLHGLQIRYDILSIRWTGWRFVITHYCDAFRPIADPHRPWRWKA